MDFTFTGLFCKDDADLVSRLAGYLTGDLALVKTEHKTVGDAKKALDLEQSAGI